MKRFYSLCTLLLGLVGLGLLLSMTLAPHKVFVIGDSISMQYGPHLEKFLGDGYVYDRLRKNTLPFQAGNDTLPFANGQDSRNVRKVVEGWKKNLPSSPDLLVLNCGLHDIKFHLDTQENQVPLADYRDNLSYIFTSTKEMNIAVLWVRTTPVVDSIHNKNPRRKFHRRAKDLDRYQQVADELCQQYGIPQVDLFDFTQRLGNERFVDHVHFDQETRALQGAYLAGIIHQWFRNK